MSEFGSGGRGNGGKRGGGKGIDPNASTWANWNAQGLPLPSLFRKASGRIYDAGWVVPRIQRHLQMHPEPAGGYGVQRKERGGGSAGGVNIPEGGGSPLSAGIAGKMQQKLGADLSDVKVHTGGDSAKASQDLSARAFTVGTDVHFNAGEFDPSSKEGEKLLAHELTHVAQNKKGGVQRKEEDGGEEVESAEGEQLEVSDPDEPAEKEADAVAEEAVEGNEDEGTEAASEGAAVSRKIHRAATTPAARPAGAGAGPAADPNQVAFEPQSTTAPTHGGTEPIQFRPSRPGGDGPAELMVANQKGATRLRDILSGPLSAATNKAGVSAVNEAIAVVQPAADAIAQLEIKGGKVDKAKQAAVKPKVAEVVSAVSAVANKLKTNSLEKAKFVTPMKNKQTVMFQKPDPNEWKTPYIGKFISEMVKQLQQQNTGLNNLSLDEWTANRERFSPTEHLNAMHDSAKQEVLARMKEKVDEGLPRAQARLTRLQTKKSQLAAAAAALQAAPATPPDQVAEALKKAKAAASDVKELQNEIQGYLDAGPEIQTGQAGGTMNPAQMQGAGGREDGQTAWANKHRKAKEAIVKLVQANDPLVAEWVGLVKETGDLAVLHDPDQIAGGRGDIEPLPVVKEPTDPNDTDGHEAWREYLTKVKAHLGVRDINSSLGSQWKTRIGELYTKVTTDPDNPQEAYALRKMNVDLKPE